MKASDATSDVLEGEGGVLRENNVCRESGVGRSLKLQSRSMCGHGDAAKKNKWKLSGKKGWKGGVRSWEGWGALPGMTEKADTRKSRYVLYLS